MKIKALKKIVCIVLVLTVSVCIFSSCGKNENGDEKNDGISIVCTVFPQYDWLREILGTNPGNISLTLLLDSGADLHSYQPTATDLMKIGEADLFVYIGGESDEKWVPDVLNTAGNGVETVNLLDELDEAQKLLESSAYVIEEDGEEEEEYDEHIWLSLKKAVMLCSILNTKLGELDADNAAYYTENCKAYCEKLNALDEKFVNAIPAEAKVTTVVCADRFPFAYLFEDYGLKYFAAFSGCSAESEASFKTVTGLAEKVDEYGLNYVFQTEKPLADIAKTVIDTTKNKNQKILSLDSMQSVTAQDIENGTNYYSVMEKNINTLIEGLKN